MKRVNLWSVVLASMLAYMTASCAVDAAEDTQAIQERVFNAYIRANGYGNAETIGDSIYVVERSGAGVGLSPTDSTYAMVRYTAKYPTGEYAAYNYDSIAVHMGTYKKSNFYGSYIWPVKMGYVSDPLSDIVKNMKSGERTVTIVPPWLSNYNSTSAFSSNSSIVIYDILLEKVIDDVKEYQASVMQEFSDKYFNGMDTTKTGFYFHKFYKSETEDTIADGSSLQVRYVGRMLDGTVFDTNIEDTAKKYDLWDKSAIYDALTLLYYVNDPEKIAEESSLVQGFCMAFTSGMTYGDKCFIFFDSDLGYGSSGSLTDGAGIPPFYPISFEIWIEDEN